MKHKGLLILVVLTVLAVGYSFYDVESEKKTEIQKGVDDQIFHLEKEKIKALDFFEGSEKQPIVQLMKDGEAWKILSPIREDADPSTVETFLTSLLSEKKESEIKPEPLDLKVFGLEVPKGKLKITTDAAEPVEVAVGLVQNVDGNVYLRINQESRVLIAGSVWTSKVTKKAFDFRNRKLLWDGVKDVQAMAVTAPKGKFNLKYVDGKWTDADDGKIKLDQAHVRNIVEILNTNSIQEFLTELPPQKKISTKRRPCLCFPPGRLPSPVAKRKNLSFTRTRKRVGSWWLAENLCALASRTSKKFWDLI